MTHNFKDIISPPFIIYSTNIYETFATCQELASWLGINKENDHSPHEAYSLRGSIGIN